VVSERGGPIASQIFKCLSRGLVRLSIRGRVSERSRRGILKPTKRVG
jgi:hypothetical protein